MLGSFLKACQQPSGKLSVTIRGANATVGHLLRDQQEIRPPVSVSDVDVLIVGGGVSGLSAARYLVKQGYNDIKLLELDDRLGGNARWSENEVSAFPCGAHYVPIPNNNLTEYLEFLQESNVIIGYDDNGLPIYNELHLCFDPEERLFINGIWQEGLVPDYGVPAPEKEQVRRFLQQMDQFRYLKGVGGEDAFAIPVELSAKDPVFVLLDQMTMKEWLDQQGFTSEYLHAYVNYCCRDDYGTRYDEVSAWAGIHYFASRKGKAANATHADVLTWPEGNGFLVQQLATGMEQYLQTGCLVTKVTREVNQVLVDYYDVKAKQYKRFRTKQCILAIPQYVIARVLADEQQKNFAQQYLHYAPWMVANIKLRSVVEQQGVSVCWDNVIHGAKGLGYVDATHQLLQQHHTHKNFTYYFPITHLPPKEARNWARNMSEQDWGVLILEDMKRVYPDLATRVEDIQVTVWGHAMAQPLPGIIFGEFRQKIKGLQYGRVHFANTDLAGISIFEEAFYQGIHAAKAVMKQ